MNKIRRVEVALTKKNIDKIKDYFDNNIESFSIVKTIKNHPFRFKISGGKGTFNHKTVELSIVEDNHLIDFKYKYCENFGEVFGVKKTNRPTEDVYINICEKYSTKNYTDKYDYYKNNLEKLTLNNIKQFDCLNYIIWSDFSKRDNIMLASFYLLNFPQLIYDKSDSYNLFLGKLQYIGVDLTYFERTAKIASLNSILTDIKLAINSTQIFNLTMSLIFYLKTHPIESLIVTNSDVEDIKTLHVNLYKSYMIRLLTTPTL